MGRSIPSSRSREFIEGVRLRTKAPGRSKSWTMRSRSAAAPHKDKAGTSTEQGPDKSCPAAPLPSREPPTRKCRWVAASSTLARRWRGLPTLPNYCHVPSTYTSIGFNHIVPAWTIFSAVGEARERAHVDTKAEPEIAFCFDWYTQKATVPSMAT